MENAKPDKNVNCVWLFRGREGEENGEEKRQQKEKVKEKKKKKKSKS